MASQVIHEKAIDSWKYADKANVTFKGWWRHPQEMQDDGL
jgi:starvation-inducible outer membrane lipoprotein